MIYLSHTLCAEARGERGYQIHYQNEDGNLGTRDIPFYIPDDEDRKQLALPYGMRVFHVKSEDLNGAIRVALCY